MTDVLIVPAVVEPLSRARAKTHLRNTVTAEDALIDGLIAAARGHVEEYCTKALMLQTRRLSLDCFPACIELLRGPLRSVSSIQYVDAAGVLQTLDAAQYRVDKLSLPARITPAYGVTWPSTYPVSHAVTVTYTAGYWLPFTADAATDVLTCAGHGFADGDATPVETIGATLPTGLAAATNYYARDVTTNTLKLAATSGGVAIDVTAAGTAPNVLGNMPAAIVQAMLLIIGHLFEHREENSEVQLFRMPMAYQDLLSPYRVVRF